MNAAAPHPAPEAIAAPDAQPVPRSAPDPDALGFDDVVSGAFDAAQEQDLPLPTASGIQEMADLVFSTRPLQGRDLQLRMLLKEFDQLIAATR